MNSIEKQHLIKRKNLSEAHYFKSFLQEAFSLNLLTDSELEDIEMQSLKLLAKQTERYTFGDSSSVKVETAQKILESIFYCIGIYLKTFQDTDVSLNVLKQDPLSMLFQQGRKLIDSKFIEARQMLSSVQTECIITDNIAYNDTVQNGIGPFFKEYDADYAAQDAPGSVDYPLSNDKMDLAGIEYIYNYLQKLGLENEFCKNFSDHNIADLLQGYNDHYQDLLINIFELVLTNAVGLTILNKDVLRLDIIPSDAKKLELKLKNMSKSKLNTVLQEASAKLSLELNISNKLLQNHMSEALINLPVRIKNALEIGKLEYVFINMKQPGSQSNIRFEEGKKIEDELFRKITDEIRSCRFVSDKAAIIKKEIHAVSDLMDVLESSCIFDEEFDEIFKTLSDMELALLSKKLPAYIVDTDFHITENEKEWQNRLKCFLDKIDLSKKKRISDLAKKINLD
ncbi:MAG: DUF6179 domain-containing protein [Bacillota bacterium]|nr:DUF6179 domain-containing protein [Bacillota bacterium]